MAGAVAPAAVPIPSVSGGAAAAAADSILLRNVLTALLPWTTRHSGRSLVRHRLLLLNEDGSTPPLLPVRLIPLVGAPDAPPTSPRSSAAVVVGAGGGDDPGKCAPLCGTKIVCRGNNGAERSSIRGLCWEASDAACFEIRGK